MKWLAAFLCLLAMPALAEEQVQQQNIRPLPTVLLCSTQTSGEGLEKEYGEIPFIEGDAQVMSPAPGKAYYGTIRMFVNPETFSYTILFDLDDQYTCLLTTGDKLVPAYQGDPL